MSGLHTECRKCKKWMKRMIKKHMEDGVYKEYVLSQNFFGLISLVLDDSNKEFRDNIDEDIVDRIFNGLVKEGHIHKVR